MMYRKLLLICFTASILLCGCTSVEKEYYPDNQLKSQITYKSGKKNGHAIYYHANGEIQIECNYLNDKLDGVFRRFYGNGTAELFQEYREGQQHGLNRYFDANGNLLIESNYSNGKVNGAYHEWYPNRRIRSEGQYLHGMIDGKWIYYDLAGNIIGTGEFNEGTGVQKSFYENGALKSVNFYKKNNKDGEEITYFPDGKIESRTLYLEGKRVESPIP